jgi:hypothetical protein
MQIKSIKPHKEISQQPTKSRKIPLGNLITKKVHRQEKEKRDRLLSQSTQEKKAEAP